MPEVPGEWAVPDSLALAGVKCMEDAAGLG